MKGWKSVAVVLSPLVIGACLLGGRGNILAVKPHPAGVQMLPQEMTSLLLDHNYERIRIKETGIDWSASGYSEGPARLMRQQGTIVVTTLEYRMLFRSLDDPASFVEVRIKRDSGFTRLTFYEEGREGLSESARSRMRMVKEDLGLRYGAQRVRTK